MSKHLLCLHTAEQQQNLVSGDILLFHHHLYIQYIHTLQIYWIMVNLSFLSFPEILTVRDLSDVSSECDWYNTDVCVAVNTNPFTSVHVHKGSLLPACWTWGCLAIGGRQRPPLKKIQASSFISDLPVVLLLSTGRRLIVGNKQKTCNNHMKQEPSSYTSGALMFIETEIHLFLLHWWQKSQRCQHIHDKTAVFCYLVCNNP